MSRTYHQGDRRIRVRGVKKDPPDLRRIARALIAFAQAEAEAEAQRQAEDVGPDKSKANPLDTPSTANRHKTSDESPDKDAA